MCTHSCITHSTVWAGADLGSDAQCDLSDFMCDVPETAPLLRKKPTTECSSCCQQSFLGTEVDPTDR